ncbi:MAG TPA: DUF6766 family protein [Gemmatimonadales bacterium]|nr:DUF6766 family protein [Gemmatimonadales bacterium]
MSTGRFRAFLNENSLSLAFGALFLAALAAQAFAGVAEYNDQQIADGLAPVSVAEYVTSSDYAVDVAENWQSEFLQFFLYITATVWLVQRGSPESKQVGEEGRGTDEEQKLGAYATDETPSAATLGGLTARLYARSLGLVMGTIVLACWLTQSIAGWATYNEERLTQLRDPLPWTGYLGSADFWSRSLQNWQSEFLAVGAMAVFSIYLRERGSPESKPTGEPDSVTGVTS